MATTPSSGQIIQRTSEIVSNVHGWSSGMSLIAGVPFNILLVVMIFHYTPMRLRDYSPIMLQTCFSDLAILFISELVQPVRNIIQFFYNRKCVSSWTACSYCWRSSFGEIAGKFRGISTKSMEQCHLFVVAILFLLHTLWHHRAIHHTLLDFEQVSYSQVDLKLTYFFNFAS